MLKIRNKERARELLREHASENLSDRIAYLASYGSEDVSVQLIASDREPWFDVIWERDGKPFMWGGLLPHNGDWSVNT